jgi:hypothetical protein
MRETGLPPRMVFAKAARQTIVVRGRGQTQASAKTNS